LNRFGLSGAARRLPALAALMNLPSARNSQPWLTAAAVATMALLAVGGYWAATNRDELARNFAALRNSVSPPPDAAAQSATTPAPIAPSEAPPAATAPAATAPAANAPAANAPTVTAPAVTATPPRQAASNPGAAAAPNSSAAPAAGAASAMSATPAPATSRAAAPQTSPADRAAAIRAGTAGPIRIEMVSDTVDVPIGESTAHVSVRRRGNIHGEASFKWWTESGTAKPGVDFVPVIPRVGSIEDGRASVSLDIPVSADHRTQSKSFYVVIDQSESGGASLGARNLTMVTLPPPD
jgi:hypothetical protein